RSALSVNIGIFVGAKNKQFVLDDRTAHCAPKAVVVKRWLARKRSVQDRAFRKVIQSVVVAVLVVPLARSVPVVRSGFRNQAELSARGMSVLRAELIRRQIELDRKSVV